MSLKKQQQKNTEQEKTHIKIYDYTLQIATFKKFRGAYPPKLLRSACLQDHYFA